MSLVSVCVYVCMRICVYVSIVYVCMCIYIYIYIYIRISIIYLLHMCICMCVCVSCLGTPFHIVSRVFKSNIEAHFVRVLGNVCFLCGTSINWLPILIECKPVMLKGANPDPE